MAQVHTARRPAGWVPWAVLGVFLLLYVMYGVVKGVAPKEQAKLYKPGAQAMLVVPFEGRLWKPEDRNVLSLSDKEMVAMDEAVGVTVFARPADSLGGGGGLANVAEPPGVAGRYYLKVGKGKYVLLEVQPQWAPQ